MKKHSFEYVKKGFSEQGCELLETEYIHSKHPMNYKCVCGNISYIKWNHFQRGERCKECKRAKFIGENNHKWNPNLTNEDRIKSRKTFDYKKWTRAVFERDDYTCQVCKKRGGDIVAHHLNGYDWCKEHRLDLNNGLTLCKMCHKQFHCFYGYGKNTREEFVNLFLFSLNQISEWDFIEATEECAKSVYPYIGCGNPNFIDEIAVNSLKEQLNQIKFSGNVILCEGIKDDSHILQGRVGQLDIPSLDLDLVCDPVDGSKITANGQLGGCVLLVLASKNTIYIPKNHYIKKAIVNNALDEMFGDDKILSLPIKEIVKKMQFKLGRKPVICLLNRDRNKKFIDEFRKYGCSIKLIEACDVFGSLEVINGKIDMYYGIGGSPEAILTTSAIKAFKGRIEIQEVASDWTSIGEVLSNDEIINGYSIFIATGITDTSLLKGVENTRGKIITHTLFASDYEKHTTRWVTTEHKS